MPKQISRRTVPILSLVFFFLVPLVLITPSQKAVATSTYLATCEAGTSVTIVAEAYADGWLLCNSADTYEGSEQLYKESPVGSGKFTRVAAGGGWYMPQDLVLYGVSRADAGNIVSTIADELNVRMHHRREPRRTCCP